jgi:hypothetical protein
MMPVADHLVAMLKKRHDSIMTRVLQWRVEKKPSAEISLEKGVG